MGIKPVPLTYPAEWLLDIFNNNTPQQRRPYVGHIQTPPMPWLLDWGWPIIGVLTVAAILVLLLGLH